MNRRILTTTLFLAAGFGFSTSFAGQGDLIVKFKSASAAKTALRSMPSVQAEELVPGTNIQLVKPTVKVLSTKALLKSIRENLNVEWAQLDHQVTVRETVPNDEMFSQQWSLQSGTAGGINATMAWDIGQGGKNADGNDVVVAVVDEGVFAEHIGLAENMWTNPREIAGNGVDDDGNGYIDDIHGWNGAEDKSAIRPGRHGTHVAGIMGAVGNDRNQTVGVNWNIKIMSAQALGGSYGGDFTSTVLRTYGYVLKQKQLFLESGGVRGANVVATNSSFGVDYADCNSGDYPAWNDMYTQLGQAGILSAAATINGALDVDTGGDVPTGCNSDYLVTVTNTTNKGQKYASAGWGKTTIDIGAPGTDIVSTVLGNQTQSLTGTSMATPHVTGAIGFLYSVASKEFQEFARTSPGEAALKMKEMLLGAVTPQADLKDTTVSGGRLNLELAAKKVAHFVK